MLDIDKDNKFFESLESQYCMKKGVKLRNNSL